MTISVVLRLAALTATAAFAPMAAAQADSTPVVHSDSAAPDHALHLTIHDVGLAIGNARHVDGVRLNYRDRGRITVHGLNATLWYPYEPAEGTVTGIALGVPVTGARSITGLAVGFGVGADRSMDGVAVGAVGVGSGRALNGVMIGGLGAGAGDDVQGIAVGGLGVGSGRNVRGVMLGGLGAGAGGSLAGIAIGGLGVGAGGDVAGLMIGGLGVGAGGSLTGIAIGGLGVGAGGRTRGILIGGLGVGSGDELDGLAIAGLGAGAPRVHGVVIAPFAGGEDFTGLALAPAYFRVTEGGTLHGVSASAFNQIRGAQHGLTIGIVNYAHQLHGIELGLLNFAGNNHGLARWLPIVNFHR